jgi:CHASE3 domain sensor protein
MLSLSGHSPKTADLPKRLKYIAAAMIVAIAAATSICTYVLNNNLIGGSSYSTLRTSATTIEQIALIRSNLFQIENTVNHLATDHEAGLEKLKSLTTQTDLRLSGLPALLSTEDSHTAAVKSDTIWKEYKKTLLEEIIPAAKQSNIIKVNYLTTGIQAQRLTIMDKGLARLSAELREGIEQTEQGIMPAGDINLMIAGLVVSIVIGMSALCLLFYHAHPKALPEGVPAIATVRPDYQKQHETHLSAKAAHPQDQIIYAPLIALACPDTDADYAGIADWLIKTVKVLSENIDEIKANFGKNVYSLQSAEGIDTCPSMPKGWPKLPQTPVRIVTDDSLQERGSIDLAGRY